MEESEEEESEGYYPESEKIDKPQNQLKQLHADENTPKRDASGYSNLEYLLSQNDIIPLLKRLNQGKNCKLLDLPNNKTSKNFKVK